MRMQAGAGLGRGCVLRGTWMVNWGSPLPQHFSCSQRAACPCPPSLFQPNLPAGTGCAASPRPRQGGGSSSRNNTLTVLVGSSENLQEKIQQGLVRQQGEQPPERQARRHPALPPWENCLPEPGELWRSPCCQGCEGCSGEIPLCKRLKPFLASKVQSSWPSHCRLSKTSTHNKHLLENTEGDEVERASPHPCDGKRLIFQTL